MDRDALLPAILALLGLAALLGAVALYPHAGQMGGHHSVERVDAPDVPDDAEVMAYETLSPEAKDVFQQALDAPDGDVVVWGASNLPPEFHYSDEEGYYHVRYEGAYYLLSTLQAGAGPVGVVQFGIEGLLGVVGLGLLAAGGYRYSN